MMKIKLMKPLFTAIFLALAGTLFCACVASDEGRRADAEARAVAKNKKARQAETLKKMVVIRMNDDYQFCIGMDDSHVLSAPEFSQEIQALGAKNPGKPVLIFVDDDFRKSEADLITFAVRECARAKLGKVYYEIPDNL